MTRNSCTESSGTGSTELNPALVFAPDCRWRWRPERCRYGRARQAGVLVVVHIHAIQGDVVLIAPRAQHFAVRGDARLEAQQLNDVSGLERKLANLILVECVAD